MIPTGIYLMEADPERLSALHPSWDKDMRALGPWEPAGPDAPDNWLRARRETSATVVLAESCASSMELARRLVEEGVLGPWGAVVCARQTEGRGQLRRPWQSLPGNVHASIVLPPTPSDGAWAGAMRDLLPLVAGHVVSEVLTGLGGEFRVKWPNDILQNNRKVGGILIEERNGVSIVGAGLNLADCPSDLQMREDHSVPAGKTRLPYFSGGPGTLVETLVSRGKSVYVVMLDEIPPTRFITMFESKLAWFGRTILVREGDDTSYEAALAGLSLDGGLVLLRGGERSVLHSGSIFPL
ncbi:biotin--acetyl-CoA-carboxylase ligase [Pseudodesulfovibrio indicus]|uniref:Biotin--acetyl-CoA-carboxylase ligase n=2 Tax=Pseudodesulfovibrio indicus TaxID=1716143 RepID=A0ABN4M187_9BACT|nr:biotin--acetyl-CoA-carboxylase ligase [Pseudodesulfovibrio indicus]